MTEVTSARPRAPGRPVADVNRREDEDAEAGDVDRESSDRAGCAEDDSSRLHVERDGLAGDQLALIVDEVERGAPGAAMAII